MGEQPDTQAKLKAIANTLRSGGNPPVVTVRLFLQWFGAQRRGYWIVKEIRDELTNAGLRTSPDFESAYIDSEISFALAQPAKGGGAQGVETTVKLGETVGVAEESEVKVVGAAFADPTYRMSKLAAANRVPTAVKPDATLNEAVTVMMANDFSQLPVMPNERDVKGIISWRAIGMRLALGQKPAVANDAMEPHAEIGSDANLFSAIPSIVEHGYVLVRGADQRIVGIVTTSDLSLQFQQLAEPFLLSGEIENHLRRIIGTHFGAAELQSAREPGDDSREVKTVADLTFGEYERLLEEPSHWARLKLQVDHAVFIKLLDKVREIRNDVMHFDPDGIPNEDLEALRDFAKFLRTLQTLGVT